MQRQMKHNDSDLGPYELPGDAQDLLWIAVESGENYFQPSYNAFPLRKWTSVEISQFRNYAVDLKVRFMIWVLLKN